MGGKYCMLTVQAALSLVHQHLGIALPALARICALTLPPC